MNKAADLKKERIALYGGAFDPIHNAHLAVAHYALEQAKLKQVIFIPAAQSPLKKRLPSSKQEDRLEMLSLAIKSEARFMMDLCEVEAGGMSYTIHTVRKMRARFPEAELFWIIGGDQFEQLERWFAIEALAELVTFLVIKRSGSGLPTETDVGGLRFQMIDAPMMDVSSTQIRRNVREGKSIQDLVPEKVAAFIDRRGLYKL